MPTRGAKFVFWEVTRRLFVNKLHGNVILREGAEEGRPRTIFCWLLGTAQPRYRAEAQWASHNEVRLPSASPCTVEVVIPHTQIQGQLAGKFPVILHVAGIVPLRIVYVGRD